MDEIKHLYLVLNNIETHLITFGNPFSCTGQDVIVCITGNPGLPEFYIEFATDVFKQSGYPICIIGQAGHEEVKDYKSNVLKGQENLFDLWGQVDHKLALIEKIDKSNKLHLIGHSIGSWMVVELLNKYEKVNTRVSTINLLFPTVQRMAESKNGIFFNNVLRRIHFLVMLFFSVFNLLPLTVKKFIIDIYLKLNSLPSHLNSRVIKYLNPRVGEKVLFLAYKEMDEVLLLNNDGLSRIKDKTNIIYGSNDGWAPVEYMDSLKQFQPALTMKEVDIDHTFVLNSSEPVADLVIEFIKKKH